MKYYRVKPQFDNMYINPCKHDGNILVANELFTEKEFLKLLDKGLKRYSFLHNMFDIVEIPKSRIYWFFGVRFENGTNWETKQDKTKQQGRESSPLLSKGRMEK